MTTLRAGEPVPKDVGDAEVIDPSGQRVALRSFWADKPCLLVFLRHFGCIGCSEQLYELVPRMAEIERVGVRTVLVGNGTPLQRDGFVERHSLATAPALVMTDPSLEAYRRFFFKRSVWATLGPRALVDAARAMSHGHPHKPVEGDGTQQGGVVLVDTRGVIRLYHASRSLGDHPPAADLVAAALRLAIETSPSEARI